MRDPDDWRRIRDDGRAIDFVVESDRAQLSALVQRVRDGRLRTHIGAIAPLNDAVAAVTPTARRPGKTIVWSIEQAGGR